MGQKSLPWNPALTQLFAECNSTRGYPKICQRPVLKESLYKVWAEVSKILTHVLKRAPQEPRIAHGNTAISQQEKIGPIGSRPEPLPRNRNMALRRFDRRDSVEQKRRSWLEGALKSIRGLYHQSLFQYSCLLLTPRPTARRNGWSILRWSTMRSGVRRMFP